MKLVDGAQLRLLPERAVIWNAKCLMCGNTDQTLKAYALEIKDTFTLGGAL